MTKIVPGGRKPELPSYAQEGTAKPPTSYVVWVEVLLFLISRDEKQPHDKAPPRAQSSQPGVKLETFPYPLTSRELLGKRLFSAAPKQSPSSEGVCRVTSVCQSNAPSNLKHQESTRNHDLCGSARAQRTPAHSPACPTARSDSRAAHL